MASAGHATRLATADSIVLTEPLPESHERAPDASLLTELMQGAIADAEARKSVRSLAQVEAAAVAQAPALDALEALAPAAHVKIIAEVKRASPSRGEMAEIPDPAALAVSYELGGASAISVLTEQRRFGGSLGDLEAVRGSVAVPVLRKDFIAEPYQVFEARAAGADLVLRSEEHTSELQSRPHLVCRLLLEKKKKKHKRNKQRKKTVE